MTNWSREISLAAALDPALRLIALQGADAFYRGPIGKKIVADSQAHRGLITAADLQGYKPVERKPVRGSYRQYEIVTMPPPSSGGIHLLQILNIMEGWPIGNWGQNSAQTVHHMAEAMKLAYADRAEYLGDPDYVKIPQTGLVSRKYATLLRSHARFEERELFEAVTKHALPPPDPA